MRQGPRDGRRPFTRPRQVDRLRAALVALLFGLAWSGSAMSAPRTLETHLLDPLSSFLERNGLDAPDPEARDRGALHYVAPASEAELEAGYTLAYRDGACAANLPAARLVQIGHVAGSVEAITTVLPLEPLSLDRARELAVSIAGEFAHAGWERLLYRPDVSASDIAENGGAKQHTLARFRPCNLPGTLATITIKSFNDLPTAPSIPIVPRSAPDDDAAARYILNVSILAYDPFDTRTPDLNDDLEARLRARRMELNGSANSPLPLDTWLSGPQ